MITQASDLVIYDGTVEIWKAGPRQPHTILRPRVFERPTSFYIIGTAVFKDVGHSRTWNTWVTTPSESSNENRFVSLQDDGNLLVVDVLPLWRAHQTKLLATGSPQLANFAPKTSLEVGKIYSSGLYTITYQKNGNLIILDKNKKIPWQSNTSNQGGTKATMQADGNCVISNDSGKTIWQTATSGHPGAYAQLQTNGNFVIVSQSPAWARFGFTPSIKPKKKLTIYGPYKYSWSFP